jgi:asparagine synthetase A
VLSALDSEIKFQNFITESVVADVNDRPSKNPKNICTFCTQEEMQKPYPRFPHLTPKEAAVAFLLDLGFVFANDDGGTTIGVVMFIAEGLGFVVQL